MPPPGLSRSDATLSTSSAPRMIVAGFQVRSPSLSVRHDVFLGAVDPVGEPVATAFGPGGRRHLVCAASLEQDTVSLGDLVDDPAHHLGSKNCNDQPPWRNPPLVSSAGPPGACTTPSRLMNSLTTTRIVTSPCQSKGPLYVCGRPTATKLIASCHAGWTPVPTAVTRPYRRTRAGAMLPNRRPYSALARDPAGEVPRGGAHRG